ncbi:MAG: hypothetical protein CMD18_02615 [Flavobacteriales bacterium]|nr:hypothetical protein [Flavobacteriales bacterium]
MISFWSSISINSTGNKSKRKTFTEFFFLVKSGERGNLRYKWLGLQMEDNNADKHGLKTLLIC